MPAIKPGKVYKITVTEYGVPSKAMKGFLLHIGDSALRVSQAEKTYGATGGNSLPYFNLERVTIVQKGKLRRTMGYTTLAGMVLGGLVGYATYTKPQARPGTWFTLDIGPGMNAVAGIGTGAVAGLLVGVIIGSVQTKYRVAGKKENYESLRQSLLGN